MPRASSRRHSRKRRLTRKGTRRPLKGGNSEGKAMVIVEPRTHKLLARVIKNFDERMDPDWDLYVFHGKSHGEFAKNATAGITKRRVFLKPLETDNLNADEYNRLFQTIPFWDQVAAENILVFQSDTALCKNFADKIDKFMKYVYIGCSYSDINAGNATAWPGHKFYGVGGLSFRKKSFMLDCIRKTAHLGNPEDAQFSDCAYAAPNKPESGAVIAEFCTQGSFTRKSFGVHKTKTAFSGNKQELFAYCPEAQLLEEE